MWWNLNQELNWRNQNGWIKCDGEMWKLKKLWAQKAEVDKSGHEETWI